MRPPSTKKGKDVEFIVKKIAKEKFTDKDRIYLVCDTFASEAVVKAAYKMKKGGQRTDSHRT